jgi:NitT/TauT family transport system substrate-binding protein
MRRRLALAMLAGALGAPCVARAQVFPRITIGMSGWPGFAPLTLAEQAGLFLAQGLEVETRFVPHRDRAAALAAGSLQAVATTLDTLLGWAATMPLRQVLVLDRSLGSDGIAVAPSIAGWAGLRGRRIAVDRPGSTAFYVLASLLRENGLEIGAIRPETRPARAAAQALLEGEVEAAVTTEPHLTLLREAGPARARILATTADHPCVVDTLAFPEDFVERNPEAVRRLLRGWFEALAMIRREPDRAHEIMGRRTRQGAAEFAASARHFDWLDLPRNRAFVATELRPLAERAMAVLRETGVLRGAVDLDSLLSDRFLPGPG